MFRRDVPPLPPPRPNPVTLNFPAASEQASDMARPNRTDGWTLFAFCCYLFMCLFFLSLSPLIHPFLSHPQVPTRKQCLVTSGVIWTHSHALCIEMKCAIYYCGINLNASVNFSDRKIKVCLYIGSLIWTKIFVCMEIIIYNIWGLCID